MRASYSVFKRFIGVLLLSVFGFPSSAYSAVIVIGLFILHAWVYSWHPLLLLRVAMMCVCARLLHSGAFIIDDSV